MEDESNIELQMALCNRIEKTYENLRKERTERRTKGFLTAKRNEFYRYYEQLNANHQQIYNNLTAKLKKESIYITEQQYEKTLDVITNAEIKIEEWLEATIFSGQMSTSSLNNESIPNFVPVNTRTEQLKLPRINIETFTGDYHKWVTFKSLYENLIHKKVELSAVEKFHHLLSNTGGEAKRLISHYSITSENYESAWNSLLSRYNNKRALVNNEIKHLMELEKLQNETANKVKCMLDTINECLNSLKNLEIDTTTWSPFLIYIFVQKIPVETNRLWQNTLEDPTAIPSMKSFIAFLENRFRTLENITDASQHSAFSRFSNNYQQQSHRTRPPQNQYAFNNKSHAMQKYQSAPSNRTFARNQNNSSQQSSSNYNNPFRTKPSQTSNEHTHLSPKTFVVNNTIKCPICNEQHLILKCERFAKMSSEQKLAATATKQLCNNCLKVHATDQCKSFNTCKVCHRRHHTMLHDTQPSSSKDAIQVLSSTVLNSRPTTQILLATALVKIPDYNGTLKTMRCLLDQGSQASFITRSAVQLLRLQTTSIIANVAGIGNSKATTNAMVQLELKSIYNQFKISVVALVMPRITDHLPTSAVNTHHQWAHIDGLELADPSFFQTNKIDILLGADIYANIMLDGVKKGDYNAPMAQNTKFGWILSGQIFNSIHSNEQHEVTNYHTRKITSLHQKVDIDTQLRTFWEIEEIKKHREFTKEEKQCETFFYNTVERDETGRFIVGLPFKSNATDLGTSRPRALIRLNQLENKFKKNHDFHKEYFEVLEEYKTLSHMIPIKNLSTINNGYYIPHHAVKKETSTTTKLRVVFDASAKTTSGESLNDQLLIGPTLQQDLSSILMRWRMNPISLAADIKQMYRQIRVRYQDTAYQRILWYNKNNCLQDYELQTLTFGTAPAAYLAVKTLQHLASIEKQNHPQASKTISEDFYVDDLLTGAETEQEAIQKYKEITEILSKGGFELRKWISNSSTVLHAIPQAAREISLPISLDDTNTTKTLGIHYHPATDEFQFKVHQEDIKKIDTKRTLLSDISRLFDPLGLLAPVIITAKIFLQRLWQEGYDWDQQLSGSLKNDWHKFRSELNKLEELRLPRWLGKTKSKQAVQIHGFCDASERAYAAVVYIKYINSDNTIRTTMVTSKTRVAPIKTISLPRLELCGAVLLANLLTSVKNSLQLYNTETFAWCDSEIVLAWLAGKPIRWKTFVANRVVEITEHTNINQWHHIKSEDNPADCASRGLFPSELAAHSLWWAGPAWLKSSNLLQHHLHDNTESSKFSTNEEQKCQKLQTFHNIEQSTIIDKFSSLSKLLRTVAMMYRFIYNCKINSNKQIGSLTTDEIQLATTCCIKLAQQEFAEEINKLKLKLPIHKKSSIITFNPFIDQDGLLRIGGRIEHADLPYCQRHPVLLPAKNNFSCLLIKDAHLKTLHGGVQVIANLLRKRYWILKSKNEAKKFIRQCVICHRYRQTSTTQLMASLPKSRLQVCRPFTNVGVDYAGPIDLKVSKGRGTKTYKGYIALFVCFSTKAVHIEVVSDLTSPAFLASFNRFISRRGLPANVYSDNGSNFVGADRILKKIIKNSIEPEVTNAGVNQGIKWHFIPARSPHFGGLWEAGIKQVKRHLIKVIRNTTLTYEELTTVLTQIEASLNSRPITPISDDPNDFSALTPGHFLIGNELLAPPSEILTEQTTNSLTKWRLLSKLHQHFWNRWNQEYTTSLQQRSKWNIIQKNCQVGDMVLIKEQNQPPNKWKLGRIEQIHPGDDGNVRVVTVNTPTGQYKRGINKLSLLPIQNTSN